MQMKAYCSDGNLVVKLDGEIDHHSAKDIRDGLDNLITDSRPKKVILELSGIDFMDKFNFEEIVIPERTYAVFETEKQRMPIPEYFDIRKQIAVEWLSNNEYQMINAPELAVYHWGIVGGYTERTIEIWIPIEKK